MIASDELENRQVGHRRTSQRPAPGDRLDAARSVEPTPAERHDYASWLRGRDDACRLMEEGADIRIVSFAASPAQVGCSDCWRKGRNAAMRVIERAR